MFKELILYHTSFEIIKEPSIDKGRSNADFGKGFYLSDDIEFSKRWARQRKDLNTYINKYKLDLNDLNIKEFNKDKEWYKYIFNNRNNYKDYLNDIDLIIGPIANDTLYDTFGLITSGLFNEDEALSLLMVKPTYKQIVIKTNKALNNLIYLDSITLNKEELLNYNKQLKEEEKLFQKDFFNKANSIKDIDNIIN